MLSGNEGGTWDDWQVRLYDLWIGLVDSRGFGGRWMGLWEDSWEGGVVFCVYILDTLYAERETSYCSKE